MEKDMWKQKLKKVFNRKSMKGFMDKFGFYFILLVCLGIIGVTAWLTRDGREDQLIGGEDNGPANIQAEGQDLGIPSPDDIDITIKDITKGKTEALPTVSPGGSPAEDTVKTPDKEDQGSAEQQKEQVNEQESADSASSKEQEGSSDSDPADNVEKPTDEAVPASAGSPSNPAVEMIMPVSGQVIRPYSADELIYSQTLREWTTHTGIDIKGTLGEEVRAALDGVVESIVEDSLQGIVITLAHENDLKTVYTGLSTGDMVKMGQSVEIGQVISGVGRTAAFEITDDPHLHFEVLLKGQHQDPFNYLKKD
jgi:murein DD-endopeptidase MepM/ murein hydrolase activator NlpD